MGESGDLTVAVCQYAPSDSAPENLDTAIRYISEAANLGAELIVLPEYASYCINPMDTSLRQHAQNLDGPFVQQLIRLCEQLQVYVVVGILEPADTKLVSNTVVAVGPAGVELVYRKQHLYDAFGQKESDWVAAGPVGVASVFQIAGFSVGMMTCYDLRFPEVARTVVDAGADIIAIPAQWIRGPLKEHHWQTLLAARAIENTAYMVAADQPAPVGVGQSAVIDPQGVRIAGLGPESGVAVARLSLAQIKRVRQTNPVLALRRYRVVPTG